MANDYCTVLLMKQAMPDVDWGEVHDAALTALITRASRAIDNHLHRPQGAFYVSADATLYFDGPGDGELWIGELAAAPTSVSMSMDGTLTYTALAAADYILWPYNALAEGMPYQKLIMDSVNGSYSGWYGFRKGIKIVGKFGFSAAVPDEIRQATIIQAMRWFKRGQQAFSDTGAVLELGQLRYTQQLDPDVALILSSPKFGRMTI